MTTLTLDLDDAKAAALRAMALRRGCAPEQFLTELIDELLQASASDFDAAVEQVLAQNRELYRRLA
jgi:hypothetical protein